MTDDARDFVRISVDLPNNPKAAGLGPGPLWLYVVSICLAGRDFTDGHVRRALIVAESHAEGHVSPTTVSRWTHAVLTAGLWHGPNHDCSDCPQPARGCVVIHDYLRHQRSRADMQVKRQTARAAAHARWNAKRNADRNAISNATSNAARNAEVEVEGEVEGDPPAEVVSHRPTAPRTRPDDDDLAKIAAAVGAADDASHARRVWHDILTRANGHVNDPLAYVLRAIGDNPGRYRPTPIPHRPPECEHGIPMSASCDRCEGPAF